MKVQKVVLVCLLGCQATVWFVCGVTMNPEGWCASLCLAAGGGGGAAKNNKPSNQWFFVEARLHKVAQRRVWMGVNC